MAPPLTCKMFDDFEYVRGELWLANERESDMWWFYYAHNSIFVLSASVRCMNWTENCQIHHSKQCSEFRFDSLLFLAMRINDLLTIEREENEGKLFNCEFCAVPKLKPCIAFTKVDITYSNGRSNWICTSISFKPAMKCTLECRTLGYENANKFDANWTEFVLAFEQ